MIVLFVENAPVFFALHSHVQGSKGEHLGFGKFPHFFPIQHNIDLIFDLPTKDLDDARAFALLLKADHAVLGLT